MISISHCNSYLNACIYHKLDACKGIITRQNIGPCAWLHWFLNGYVYKYYINASPMRFRLTSSTWIAVAVYMILVNCMKAALAKGLGYTVIAGSMIRVLHRASFPPIPRLHSLPHFLPIFCPFSTHFLPIHYPFPAHSLPISCPFTSHSLPIFCPFTSHSLPISCPFHPWDRLGALDGQLLLCSGCALIQLAQVSPHWPKKGPLAQSHEELRACDTSLWVGALITVW